MRVKKCEFSNFSLYIVDKLKKYHIINYGSSLHNGKQLSRFSSIQEVLRKRSCLSASRMRLRVSPSCFRIIF